MGVITTKLDAEWAEKQIDDNMFAVRALLRISITIWYGR